MGRVWLDVTSLLRHKGNLTGCVRVEANLLKYLYLNKEWGLFFFDSNTGIVEVIDRGDEQKNPEEIFLQFRETFEQQFLNVNKRKRFYRIFKGKEPTLNLFEAGDSVLSVGIHETSKFVQTVASVCRISGVKFYFFVHDIMGMIYPEFFYDSPNAESRYGKFYGDISFYCDGVIVNSSTTKSDFLKKFPSSKVEVIELGDDFLNVNVKQESFSELPINFPFVLYVSTIEPRKNHGLIVDAYRFAEYKGNFSEMPNVVFVGRQGWGKHPWQEYLNANRKLRSKFKVLEDIDDEELRWLYQNATAFLYPSFYEGWGLPVREALIFGKFCIISNQGALREHNDPRVLHLSPWNAEAWYESILNLDRQKREYSFPNIELRTWHQFSEEVFSSILGEAPNT